MKHLRPMWAALAVLTTWSCGDGPATPVEPLDLRPTTLPELHPGDEVHVEARSDVGPLSWVSREPWVAGVGDGLVEAFRPGGSWIVASSGEASDSLLLTVTPRPGGYTTDEVDYFVEIAPGFEFGGASDIIRKWGQDITVRVNGDPSADDLAALETVVSEINALIAPTSVVLVATDPLVELHFAPTSRFVDILPSWVPGNVGYFSLWWGASQFFTRGVVLIATDVDASLRRHLIREELTQVLGLGNDSFTHANSIFYQLPSSVSEYAPVDRAVIEMLYRSEVQVGMAPGVVAGVVRRLTRLGAAQRAPVASPTAAPSGVLGVPGRGAGGRRRPAP